VEDEEEVLDGEAMDGLRKKEEDTAACHTA
jgi:hypothetical protein